MSVYPAALDVSTRSLTFLAAQLVAHRRAIGSRWRRLSAQDQALLVLAYLRKGETYTALAAGFGIGVSTAYRYIREAIKVLAALAPSLHQALRTARHKAYLILDGTLLSIDRVGMASGADRPYFSGKQKRHGVNVQVITGPSGELVWVSPALPGARHDVAAARTHAIPAAVHTAGMTALADTAYQGAGPAVKVPQRRRRRDPSDPDGGYLPLSANQKAVNTAHARLRAPGERGPAQLKTWRILRKIRSSPSNATQLVQAVHTLMINDR